MQRCCPLSQTKLIEICPICGEPATGLHLIPLAFDEIDQATAEAAQTSLTNKRGKKRQNATVARLNPSLQNLSSSTSAVNEEGASAAVGELSELRTGRWTPEETAYCDKLIYCFEQGYLPIPDKMKLNDFLSTMLKSKQSRLTKKMKNAKLSAKQYKRNHSVIMSEEEARELSKLETDLFASIKCRMERSELRFHMQKVWRDMFTHFCSTIGQKLELEGWLRSVEQMEKRTSEAMNAARRARRKAMVGYALNEDTKNAQSGVLIDPNVRVDRTSNVVFDQGGEYGDVGSESDSVGNCSNKRPRTSSSGATSRARSSSFVARVMHYVQMRQVPFEHVDVWVPSAGSSVVGGDSNQVQRLAYGGCATADSKIVPQASRSAPLTTKEQYDLVSFGEYSQRFSFNVGCGLPGRVFSSGIPSWEQGIKSAPSTLFERCGGARQWGVETAVGMPVSSPSVGRIVVVLYSIFDRPRDEEMVVRMTDELSRLLPMPRWKLVVDVGVDVGTDAPFSVDMATNDSRATDLKSLLQSLMGSHDGSSQQIAGLGPLFCMLAKENCTNAENDLLQDALRNYENYKRQGRADTEVAWLTCRDFLLKEALLNKVDATKAPAQTGVGLPMNAPVPGADKVSNSCGKLLNNGAVSSEIQNSDCCPGTTQQSNGCCPQPVQPSSGCCPQPVQQTSGCCPQPLQQSSGCCPSSRTNTARGCCPSPTIASGCAKLLNSCAASRAFCTVQQKGCVADRGCALNNSLAGRMASVKESGGHQALNRDLSVPDTLVLPTALANLQQDGSSLYGLDDSSELDASAVINGSMDLGLTAVQLAQLLQSEAGAFHG